MATVSTKLADAVVLSLGGSLTGRAIVTNCHKVVCQMMADRGLTVLQRAGTELELMAAIDAGKPTVRAASDPDDDPHTLVFFDAERTGIGKVRSLRERYGGCRILIVNVDGPTAFTKRDVAKDFDVEFWFISEVLFNRTRHELVPRHRRLSTEEAARVARQRCILDHQWPMMLASDMQARWMLFRPGDVVEMARRGLAHESGLYYRKVVA